MTVNRRKTSKRFAKNVRKQIMRVLLVFDGYGTGGDLAVCMDLHDYLRTSGIPFDFVAVRYPDIRDMVLERLRQRSISPIFVDSLEECKKLPALQKRGYDLVHIHNSGEYLSLKTARLYRGVFGSLKMVVTLHGPIPLSVLKPGLKTKMSSCVGSRLVDRLIVPSKHRAEELSKMFVNPRKIRVIGNPIRSFARIDKYEARTRLDLETEVPIVLWLGRISREKRPEFVLSANPFLLEKGVVALFVYAGSLYEPLTSHVLPAASNYNAQTKYVGFLADPSVAYFAADAFVLTSEYENYPLALFEALSCGVPSVAPDLPIVRNELNSHPGLYVYSQGDSRSLADALQGALLHPEAEREQISKETVAKFGYETSGKKHVELYRQLIEGRHA